MLVAVLFLFSNICAFPSQALANPAQSSMIQGGGSPAVLSSQPLTEGSWLPPELGSIDEVYRASRATDPVPRNEGRGSWPVDSKFVVFVQDAHDSLEAQENIAKIIGCLTANYGVKTVFEEGYEGPVPTDDYFGSIQDPELKRKVAYFFLDHLRIGGAEYAHINRDTGHGTRTTNKTSPTGHEARGTKESSRGPGDVARGSDFELIGADSLDLHKENVDQYRLSAERKDAIQSDLKALEKEVRSLSDARFPKEFKAWLRVKEKYDSKRLDLFTYVARTLSLLGTRDTAHEPRQNPTWFANDHAWPVARGSWPLMEFILEAVRSNDPVVIEKAKHIDAREVFSEIVKLERSIAEAWLLDATDRELYKYYSILALLSRLNELQITQEEYESVKDALKAFDTQSLGNFLHRNSRKPLVLSKQWERNIREAVKFYEIAAERDGAISQTLDKYFRRNAQRTTRNAEPDRSNVERGALNAKLPGSETAILVYGGFHKEHIKRILEAKGISYVVVSPRITKPSARHEGFYKQLMTYGAFPFEKAITPVLATATRNLTLYNGMSVSMAHAEIGDAVAAIVRNPGIDLGVLDRKISEGETSPAATVSEGRQGKRSEAREKGGKLELESTEQNLFARIWQSGEGLPFPEKVKMCASRMAWFFAKDDVQQKKIEADVRQLKVIEARKRPVAAFAGLLASSAQLIFGLGEQSHGKLVLELARGLFGEVSKWPVNSNRDRFRKSAAYVLRGGVWVVLSLIVVGFIAPAAFVGFLASDIWRIYLLKKSAATYLNNWMIFYEKDPSFGVALHEIFHWMQDKGYIASDLPVAGIAEAYLGSPLNESFMEEPQHVLPAILSLEAEDSAVYLRRYGQKKIKLDRVGAYEHEDVYELSKKLGTQLQIAEKSFNQTGRNGWLLVPTVLFMRSQVFEDKDMLAMDQEKNIKKLLAIYGFAYWLCGLTDFKVMATGSIRTKVHGAVRDLMKGLDDAEQQRILDLTNVWISRLASEGFQEFMPASTAHVEIGDAAVEGSQVKRSEARKNDAAEAKVDVLFNQGRALLRQLRDVKLRNEVFPLFDSMRVVLAGLLGLGAWTSAKVLRDVWNERSLAKRTGDLRFPDIKAPLGIDPSLRSEMRTSNESVVAEPVKEISQQEGPSSAAQKVGALPSFVITEDTGLQEIVTYVHEVVTSAVAGVGADMAIRVLRNDLLPKLELIRDGRAMGHPVCLGCANGGICPMVAALLRGKKGKEDKNCATAKRPRISDQELRQALHTVDDSLKTLLATSASAVSNNDVQPVVPLLARPEARMGSVLSRVLSFRSFWILAGVLGIAALLGLNHVIEMQILAKAKQVFVGVNFESDIEAARTAVSRLGPLFQDKTTVDVTAQRPDMFFPYAVIHYGSMAGRLFSYVIASLGGVFLYLRGSKRHPRIANTGLYVIASGMLLNLSDGLKFSGVLDYLWYFFSPGDWVAVVGAGLLFAASLGGDRRASQSENSEAPTRSEARKPVPSPKLKSVAKGRSESREALFDLTDPAVAEMFKWEMSSALPAFGFNKAKAEAAIRPLYEQKNVLPISSTEFPDGKQEKYYSLARSLFLKRYRENGDHFPFPTMENIHIAASLFYYLLQGYDGDASEQQDPEALLTALFRFHHIKNILEVGTSDNLRFTRLIAAVLKKSDPESKIAVVDLRSNPSAAQYGIQAVQGDARQLRTLFPDIRFDLVLSTGVLSFGGVADMGGETPWDNLGNAHELVRAMLDSLSENPKAAVLANAQNTHLVLESKILQHSGEIVLWDNPLSRHSLYDDYMLRAYGFSMGKPRLENAFVYDERGLYVRLMYLGATAAIVKRLAPKSSGSSSRSEARGGTFSVILDERFAESIEQLKALAADAAKPEIPGSPKPEVPKVVLKTMKGWDEAGKDKTAPAFEIEWPKSKDPTMLDILNFLMEHGLPRGGFQILVNGLLERRLEEKGLQSYAQQRLNPNLRNRITLQPYSSDPLPIPKNVSPKDVAKGDEDEKEYVPEEVVTKTDEKAANPEPISERADQPVDISTVIDQKEEALAPVESVPESSSDQPSGEERSEGFQGISEDPEVLSEATTVDSARSLKTLDLEEMNGLLTPKTRLEILEGMLNHGLKQGDYFILKDFLPTNFSLKKGSLRLRMRLVPRGKALREPNYLLLMEEEPGIGLVMNIYPLSLRNSPLRFLDVATYLPSQKGRPPRLLNLGAERAIRAYDAKPGDSDLFASNRVTGAVIQPNGQAILTYQNRIIPYQISKNTLLRYQLKFKDRFGEKGIVGQRVVIRVENEPGRGQVTNLYLEAEYLDFIGGRSKFLCPLSTYVGSQRFDLAEMDIREYLEGKRLEPSPMRAGQAIIGTIEFLPEVKLANELKKENHAGGKIHKHLYRVVGWVGRPVNFGTLTEAQPLLAQLGAGAHVEILLENHPVYGLFLEARDPSSGKVLSTYYRDAGSEGEIYPVRFGRHALIDYAFGTDIPLEIYRHNVPVPSPKPIYLVEANRSLVIRKVQDLAGKLPLFVPGPKIGPEQAIYLHDAEAYEKYPSRVPDYILVRDTKAKTLVPIFKRSKFIKDAETGELSFEYFHEQLKTFSEHRDLLLASLASWVDFMNDVKGRKEWNLTLLKQLASSLPSDKDAVVFAALSALRFRYYLGAHLEDSVTYSETEKAKALRVKEIRDEAEAIVRAAAETPWADEIKRQNGWRERFVELLRTRVFLPNTYYAEVDEQLKLPHGSYREILSSILLPGEDVVRPFAEALKREQRKYAASGFGMSDADYDASEMFFHYITMDPAVFANAYPVEAYRMLLFLPNSLYHRTKKSMSDRAKETDPLLNALTPEILFGGEAPVLKDIENILFRHQVTMPGEELGGPDLRIRAKCILDALMEKHPDALRAYFDTPENITLLEADELGRWFLTHLKLASKSAVMLAEEKARRNEPEQLDKDQPVLGDEPSARSESRESPQRGTGRAKFLKWSGVEMFKKYFPTGYLDQWDPEFRRIMATHLFSDAEGLARESKFEKKLLLFHLAAMFIMGLLSIDRFVRGDWGWGVFLGVWTLLADVYPMILHGINARRLGFITKSRVLSGKTLISSLRWKEFKLIVFTQEKLLTGGDVGMPDDVKQLLEYFLEKNIHVAIVADTSLGDLPSRFNMDFIPEPLRQNIHWITEENAGGDRGVSPSAATRRSRAVQALAEQLKLELSEVLICGEGAEARERKGWAAALPGVTVVHIGRDKENRISEQRGVLRTGRPGIEGVKQLLHTLKEKVIAEELRHDRELKMRRLAELEPAARQNEENRTVQVRNFIRGKITPDKFSIIDDNRNHAAHNILKVLAQGKLPAVFPYQIQLDLTQFCPFWDVIQRTGKGFKDCMNCAFPGKTRRQVEPTVLIKILKNFEAYGGKSVFVTGGGEPGVYAYWHELLAFLAGSGLGLTMNTNGLFVKKLLKEDPEILRKVFSEAKDPSVISVSAHGDYAYALVAQLNELRQKLGLNIVIRTTYLVHPDTPVSELMDFLKNSQVSGADMVSFKPEHVLRGTQRVFSTNEDAYGFIQDLLDRQTAKDQGLSDAGHPYDLLITAMRTNRLKASFEAVRDLYQQQAEADRDPLCLGPLCNMYLNTELLMGMCCDTKDKGIGETPAEVFADSLFVMDRPQDYFLAAMMGMIKLNPKHCIVGCGFMEPNFTYPVTFGLQFLTDTLRSLRSAWRRGEMTEEHIKAHLRKTFLDNVGETGANAGNAPAPLLRSLEATSEEQAVVLNSKKSAGSARSEMRETEAARFSEDFIAAMAEAALNMARYIHDEKFEGVVMSGDSAVIVRTLLEAAWKKLFGVSEKPLPPVYHITSMDDNARFYKMYSPTMAMDDWARQMWMRTSEDVLRRYHLRERKEEKLVFVDDLTRDGTKLGTVQEILTDQGFKNVRMAILRDLTGRDLGAGIFSAWPSSRDREALGLSDFVKAFASNPTDREDSGISVTEREDILQRVQSAISRSEMRQDILSPARIRARTKEVRAEMRAPGAQPGMDPNEVFTYIGPYSAEKTEILSPEMESDSEELLKTHGGLEPSRHRLLVLFRKFDMFSMHGDLVLDKQRRQAILITGLVGAGKSNVTKRLIADPRFELLGDDSVIAYFDTAGNLQAGYPSALVGEAPAARNKKGVQKPYAERKDLKHGFFSVGTVIHLHVEPELSANKVRPGVLDKKFSDTWLSGISIPEEKGKRIQRSNVFGINVQVPGDKASRDYDALAKRLVGIISSPRTESRNQMRKIEVGENIFSPVIDLGSAAVLRMGLVPCAAMIIYDPKRSRTGALMTYHAPGFSRASVRIALEGFRAKGFDVKRSKLLIVGDSPMTEKEFQSLLPREDYQTYLERYLLERELTMQYLHDIAGVEQRNLETWLTPIRQEPGVVIHTDHEVVVEGRTGKVLIERTENKGRIPEGRPEEVIHDKTVTGRTIDLVTLEREVVKTDEFFDNRSLAKDAPRLKESSVFVIEQARIAEMKAPEQVRMLNWLLGFAAVNKGMLHIVIPDMAESPEPVWVSDLKRVTQVLGNVPRNMGNGEGTPVFYFSNAEHEATRDFLSRLGRNFRAENATLVDIDDGRGFVLAALLGKKVEELPLVAGFFHRDVAGLYRSEIRFAVQALYDNYVVIASAA